jgi:putative ABC transport system permease protein
MSWIRDDVAYAWRRLWRTPGFTLVAVLTLAFGIGANTALFSLMNGLLLRSLPVPHLDELVTVTSVYRTGGSDWGAVRSEDLKTLAEVQPTLFDNLVIHDFLKGVMLGRDRAEMVSGELVSGNYFPVLGLIPRAGRLLQPDDDVDRAGDVPVVISERLWRRWFDRNSDALGQSVSIAGYPLVIVGVVPDGFNGTWLPTILSADVWVPSRVAQYVGDRGMPATSGTGHRVLATLHAGLSLAQADAAAHTLQTSNPDLVLAVLPGRAGIVAKDFDRYGVLLGSAIVAMAGLVFLIACANVANLFLVRGVSRSAEMAIRLTIGASPHRLVQLLLAEIGLVTALAAIAGIVIAIATARAMNAVPLPSIEGISIRFDALPDFRVFAYAFVAASLAAVATALSPARQAARTEPLRALASGGAGASGTMPARRRWTRRVAWQMAMSVVLLIAAGLYVRSSLAALRFDPGFDTQTGVAATIDLSLQRIDDARGRVSLARLLDGLRQMPGAESAALTSALPTRPSRQTPVVRDDRLGPADTRSYDIQTSPGFFATLGIPLRRGRDFTDRDQLGSPPVTIVSARLADRLWPGANPIGRRIGIGLSSEWLEVIGVAADISPDPRLPNALFLYRPIAQAYSPKLTLLVKAAANPETLIDPLRERLRAIAPDVAVFDMRPVRDALGLQVPTLRVVSIVLASLGALGFGIAMLGVYGVVAFSVSQRQREFGVYAAVGATPNQIVAMVLRQSIRMLAFGVVPGLILALIAAGLLRFLLYGIQPRDPVTFIVVPAAVMAAGLAASFIPARRAARVNPSQALRDS